MQTANDYTVENLTCCEWIRRFKIAKSGTLNESNFRTLLLGHNYECTGSEHGGCTRHTTLHTAVNYECRPCLKILLSKNIEEQIGTQYFNEVVNTRNAKGETPLMYSLRRACVSEVIEILIEGGCDVNLTNHGGVTPLHIACRRPNSDIAILLVQKGADVDCKTAEDRTPLYEAISENCPNTVSLLLYYNAEVMCSDRYSPLLRAIMSGDRILVLLIIDQVHDINHKFKRYVVGSIYEECTALSVATMHSTVDICKDIMDRGGDVNYVCKSNGLPCVYMALHFRHNHTFRELWSRCDHSMLLRCRIDIITFFLSNYELINTEKLVEIMEIIFTSPHIEEIVEQHLWNLDRYHTPRLYERLYTTRVIYGDRKIRRDTLMLFLSYNIPIYTGEVDDIYKSVGMNEDLEMILMSGVDIRKCYCRLSTEFLSRLLYNKPTNAYNGFSAEYLKFYRCVNPQDPPSKSRSPPSLIHLCRDTIRKKVYDSNLENGSGAVWNSIRYLRTDLPLNLINVILLKSRIQ